MSVSGSLHSCDDYTDDDMPFFIYFFLLSGHIPSIYGAILLRKEPKEVGSGTCRRVGGRAGGHASAAGMEGMTVGGLGNLCLPT